MAIEQHKEKLGWHIQSVISQSGCLVPGATWMGNRGVIKAGIVGTPDFAFSVNVRFVDDIAHIGIVRPFETEVDDKPWDSRKRREVRERSFAQGERSEAEKQRFTAALKDEVASYRAKHDHRESDDAAESLAASLKELIERDPEAAAETLAGLLKDAMDADAMNALRTAVDDANKEAPQP